ncbi:hypothetical protein SHIRM173S_02176 [Streptomyces hirsutus]
MSAPAVRAALLCGTRGAHDNADLRASADAVLARFAGDVPGETRLREGPWRAIGVPVPDHRRAPAVQHTGRGRSAVSSLAPSLLRVRS